MNRQGIEGVPDHLRMVSFRSLTKGDHYLVWGKHHISDFGSCDEYPIVEPDNVYGVYDLAEVRIKAHENGEFREPLPGDYFITKYKELVNYDEWVCYDNDKRRIIVKPIAKKTRRVVVVTNQELWLKDGEKPSKAIHDRLVYNTEEREITTNGWMY